MTVQEDTKINATTELSVVHCGKCGGSYAIAERFREQCHSDGTGWNCPYCDTRWGYFGKTEAQKLQQQLAAEQAQHDQTKAECRELEARRRAEKGAKTKLKKRIANGVCPCCQRSFKDLHRHMKGQHPDYVDTDGQS